jgi:hypothetical protein
MRGVDKRYQVFVSSTYEDPREERTLRVTPAMKAGISSHVWPIQDVVALTIEDREDRIAA